jgi:hypothetical protein
MWQILKRCSTQRYLVFFTCVPCFTMLTYLVAYNTQLTWVLLGSCSRNVSWIVKHACVLVCGAVFEILPEGLPSVQWHFKTKFSISLCRNSNLVNLPPVFCGANMNWGNRYQMMKVFPVVLFQSFSSAAVTYKVSITHMNTPHHRIIVSLLRASWHLALKLYFEPTSCHEWCS